MGAAILDGRAVQEITAFLYHRGGHSDPARLRANLDLSFEGYKLLGIGFTFDDSPNVGPSSSISEMKSLIRKNAKNSEVIYPFLGGEEVNSHPKHLHHRYAINFGNRSLEAAAEWPDLLAIVRERVKPERDAQNRKAHRDRWWLYGENRPGLTNALSSLDRVIVVSSVSQYLNFALVSAKSVLSHSLKVFPFSSHAALCNLQSRVHETWARFFGSSLEERLRYTPTDCFETFPFPAEWQSGEAFEAAGRAYHDFRAELMVRTGLGLTKTYGRFHDPDERSPEIEELRQLHGALDRVVLDAYGWTDIPSECLFLREFEDEAGEAAGPYRYRWPVEVREEVLARLLELNAERAASESATARPSSARRKQPARPDSSAKLFETDDLA